MRFITIILSIILFCSVAYAKPSNILVIHSYQQEYPKTKLQHKGFIEGLKKNRPKKNFNIFIEYLNAKITEDTEEAQRYTDNYLFEKYKNNRPDLIYITDDEAANYIINTSIPFLKAKPVFFSGIHHSDAKRHMSGYFGYIEKHNIAGMVQLVNILFKSKPDIGIIGSNINIVSKIENEIIKYQKLSGEQQHLSTYISKNIDEILKSVPKRKNMVFILSDTGGFINSGRHETIKEALKKITEGLPGGRILTVHSSDLMSGVLGGLVSNQYDQGYQIGLSVAEHISGKPYIPKVFHAENSYIFDRKALEKSGIVLPKEIESKAKIINENPAFIEKYGQHIIYFVFFLLGVIIISSIAFTVSTIRQKREISDKSKKLSTANSRIQQYLNAVDASNLVSISDKNGEIKYINSKYLQTTEYLIEEIIGKKHNVLNHPDIEDEFYESLIKTIKAGNIWTGVLLNKTKSGEEIFLETSIIPIKENSGEIIEYLSIMKDITQTVKQQQQIRKQYKDPLTGLPNRTRLREDLKETNEPATAIINIDGFSIINTYYGLEAGDKILKMFTSQLRGLIKPNMEIYRLSGDEFAVLGKNISDYSAFNVFIIDLMNSLSEIPFHYEDNEIRLSFSAGTSKGNDGPLVKAGMALKQARHEKKNIMTYNEAESHMESVRDTVQYTYAIREAINNDRIVPHFQPIVDTTSRQIVKYEALMRLVDSKGSHLPPSAFLELSKKLKLYNFLSIRMMEKTIEVIKDTGHKVCINFDKEDILNNKIQERLFYLIKKYNLQGRITIEITESEGMDSVAELAAFVTRARQEGCLIAIDDFGTGYSNFMYILNLQPDFLKIDGSITRQIIDSRRAKLLTKTITEMCLSAGIKTVAEFVSSEEIYEEINSLGIDYCQGFLFGKASHNIKTD